MDVSGIVVYGVGYALSISLGSVLAGGYVWFLHKAINSDIKKEQVSGLPSLLDEKFRWFDQHGLGVMEVVVVTTLMIWEKDWVPGFVGFWVAAKMAANWNIRTEEYSRKIQARCRLVALGGSAISISIAALVGLGIVYMSGKMVCTLLWPS